MGGRGSGTLFDVKNGKVIPLCICWCQDVF